MISSWGVGDAEGWKGKTMWGLKPRETENVGEWKIERKGFFFPATAIASEAAKGAGEAREDDILPGGGLGRLEIHVFRARARKRIVVDVEQSSNEVAVRKGKGDRHGPGYIKLMSLGNVKRRNQSTYYRYALLDPVDEPWATFRWHVCSTGMLDTSSND